MRIIFSLALSAVFCVVANGGDDDGKMKSHQQRFDMCRIISLLENACAGNTTTLVKCPPKIQDYINNIATPDCDKMKKEREEHMTNMKSMRTKMDSLSPEEKEKMKSEGMKAFGNSRVGTHLKAINEMSPTIDMDCAPTCNWKKGGKHGKPSDTKES